MGLLDKVLKGVKKVSEFAKKNPDIVKSVKAVGKLIVDNVTKAVEWVKKNIFENIRENKITKEYNEQMAKKMSEKGSFDEANTTTEKIIDFDSMLDEVRDDYYKKLNNIEKSTIDGSKKILEQNIEIIENEFKPNGIEINIDSIKYKFDNLIKLFKNSFSNGVISHIAMSDYQMSNILKIENDKQRYRKINDYFNKLVKDAIEEYCENLDNITNESLKIISDAVNDNLNNTENSINNIKEEIENNIKLDIKDIEAKRKEYEEKSNLLEEFINILD